MADMNFGVNLLPVTTATYSIGSSSKKWQINGVSDPQLTNTTYTFTNGTNSFTVTPSGGTAQTVTVTPSITNNITGSGTSGYLVKFNGTNTITNGPQFGTDTTKFLNNKGEWATALTSHQDISGKVNKSGDTMTGSLIVGNLTDDVQRVINLRTSAGRIAFVSDGANDTRGIYLANADDSKHGYALTFDQDNQININYKTFFTYPILLKKDLDYSATRVESVTMPMVQVLDKNNLVRHQIYAGLNTANTAYTYLAVRDGTHSTYIGTTLDSSGNSTYEISHPVAFRNALGASSGAWPVSLGGTGTTTFTAGAALIGNGTNAITTRSITNLTTSGGSVTANTNLITANTLVNYAVKKAGDTITGSLYLTMNQVSSQINFGCDAWSYGSGTNLRDYIAETSWGTIHYDLPYVLTNQSKTLFSGQHIFTQKSPTTSGSPTNYSEYYRLPLTTAGRSSNAFYDIITTKNREDIIVASGMQTVGTIEANSGGNVTVNFSPTLSDKNYIVIVTPVVGTVNIGVQGLKTNSFDAYYRNTSNYSATANFKWAILKL